jgi:SAM-dependent methyltransferase
MIDRSVNIYENGGLAAVSGSTLRPGGFALTEMALEFCAFPAGARLLDVGCGSGASVARLGARGFSASGIDLSVPLLSAGHRAGLPLIRARAEALPCADAKFDGLISECVLCLLNDPKAALKEFFRVLAPGGRLILSDVYRRAQVAQPTLPDCHQLKMLLDGAGFRIRLWQDHSPLLAELAARLVLTEGSDKSICNALPDRDCRAERPGYYLLVAKKPGAKTCSKPADKQASA